MGNRIDKALTLGALRVALETRWSAAPHRPWQSVCGERLCTLLNARGINCSMSRKGNCWDNAVAESFFTTSKVEFVDEAMFHAPAQATRDIFEHIEVLYNRVGRHSSVSQFQCCSNNSDGAGTVAGTVDLIVSRHSSNLSHRCEQTTARS